MIEQEHQKKKPIPPKKGQWKRAIALAAFSVYALMGWLRLGETLRFWHYLKKLRLIPGPLYVAISGGAIGLFFTAAFILLVLHIKNARFFTRIVSILFLMWWWFDRIWLGRREAFYAQLGISILVTALTLLFAFLCIRPDSLPLERIVHERQTGTGS